MRILSKGTLRDYWDIHPDSKASLEFWYNTVEINHFNNSNEVIKLFKTADIIGNGRIVFNIAHNKYRLIVKFRYDKQMVFIRFIGTHSEYDKIQDIENL